MRLAILPGFIFMLASLGGRCQSMSTADSIEVVKGLLRNDGAVESLYLGLHAKPSRQCLRFLFIAKRVTAEEMRLLLDDSSSCLRLYAYGYLRSISAGKLKNARVNLQKDSSQINFLSGCVGGNTQVRYALQRMKQWEKTESFNRWMKNYKDLATKWDSLLMSQ